MAGNILGHGFGSIRAALVAAGALGVAWLAACGGDTQGDATSNGGSGGAGPSSSRASSTSGTGATGGGGGAGGGGEFVPTPADISYHAVAPLPSGEIIVFNDWNAIPNTVAAMPAGGGAATTVFEAYRVWSMGVARTSRRIAFSCGFPSDVQEQHYGTNLGDAIQHTWLYDPTSQAIDLLAYGNINDECYVFGPGETNLYLCRRYDFSAGPAFTSKGYRLGAIQLADKSFGFLTDDLAPAELDFHEAPNQDESKLLYGAVLVQSGQQHRQIEVEALPPGTPSLLIPDADAPVFAPDGTRFSFTNYGDGGALYVADADGANPVKIATEGGDGATWSPDGTHVAFLFYDETNNCQSIDVVAADGSEADAPVRIRDCATTGEFIVDIGWLPP